MTLLYRMATAVIFLGIVLMCQPLSVALFSWGFPVLLAGTVLFIALDHVPEATGRRIDEGVQARLAAPHKAQSKGRLSWPRARRSSTARTP